MRNDEKRQDDFNPVIESLTTDATRSDIAAPGSEVTVSGVFTGFVGDSHSVTVDWGDGTTSLAVVDDIWRLDIDDYNQMEVVRKHS